MAVTGKAFVLCLKDISQLEGSYDFKKKLIEMDKEH